MKYRLVPEEELMRLTSDQMVLVALVQGEVDNWGGYSESHKRLKREITFWKPRWNIWYCAEKEIEKYIQVSAKEEYSILFRRR